MIEKEQALLVQSRSLAAIRELVAMLSEIKDHCPVEDFETIKRGVGLSIGTIQMDILEFINKQYPEIDDLAEK